jgi:hypothetical protein
MSHVGELTSDQWGRLMWAATPGGPAVSVQAVRCFPLTDPQRSISLVSAEGREQLLIDDLSAVPPAMRSLVEANLDQAEFLPEIVRIHHTSGPFTPCVWRVETNRGPATVEIDSVDDVRRLGPYRVQVSDVHGLRLIVADWRTLDRHSLRILRNVL